MNYADLIPRPDAIPVHWLWLQGLLIFTFVLHLLMMNLMLGGALLTFYNRLKNRKFESESKSVPTLIALTVNLGIPPLLFLQVLFGHFFYTSSILMAVFWISIIPMLIIAYYSAYVTVYKAKRGGKGPLMSMGISSIFLLTTAFLFVNNMSLMINPSEWTRYFKNSWGTLLNLGDITIYPRYFHFIIASIAVAGLGRAVYYAVKEKKEKQEYEHQKTGGLKIFFGATLLQAFVGLWFLISLPRPVMLMFLGGRTLYTVFLALGVAAAATSLYFAFKRHVWATATSAFILVFLMVMIRNFVRSGYLDGLFTPSQLPTAPQITPFIVFLIVFATGLAVLAFMIKKVWASVQEVRT